jgi:starvation-inducible DNA-binding protein
MTAITTERTQKALVRRKAPLAMPSDLKPASAKDVAAAMNGVLADVFALYMKTKSFHWHVSGPHFRDHHLLLDEQAQQLFAMTDAIAERVRKVGATTLRSIGHISRTQRVLDNDADFVDPHDMLAELRDDNIQLTSRLRQVHNVCQASRDIASCSMIEVWIDQAEQRTWFLFEATRKG